MLLGWLDVEGLLWTGVVRRKCVVRVVGGVGRSGVVSGNSVDSGSFEGGTA